MLELALLSGLMGQVDLGSEASSLSASAPPRSELEFVARPVVGVFDRALDNDGASGRVGFMNQFALTSRLTRQLGLRVEGTFGWAPRGGGLDMSLTAGHGHAYAVLEGEIIGFGNGLGFATKAEDSIYGGMLVFSPAYHLRLGEAQGLRLEARVHTQVDYNYQILGVGLALRLPLAARWRFDLDGYGSVAEIIIAETGFRYRFLQREQLSAHLIVRGGVSGIGDRRFEGFLLEDGLTEDQAQLGGLVLGPSIALGFALDF